MRKKNWEKIEIETKGTRKKGCIFIQKGNRKLFAYPRYERALFTGVREAGMKKKLVY